MSEVKYLSADFEDICKACLDKWGVDAQLTKLLEECSELIQAIAKHSLGQGTWKQVVEEGVDVELMVNQLKELSYPSPLWFDIRDEKLARLRKQLEEDK